MGWIACDFDATLFEWGEGTSNPGDVLRVGKPIPKMVERIKAHLAAGEDVRIFTARVGPGSNEECLQALANLTEAQADAVGLPHFKDQHHRAEEYWIRYQTALIQQACERAVGVALPVTAVKDFHMYKLYDDRATQVVPNTGELVMDLLEAARAHIQEIADFDVQANPTIGDAIEGQSER